MAPARRRIRLTIAYDGTAYCGWQRQQNGRTIQGEIEQCLATMTKGHIDLHGAGRTDAGVHAEAMTAHFDCCSTISDANFFRGLNAMLTGDIRILTAKSCQSDFHARFSATGKCYQYHLDTGRIQPPPLRHYSLHVTAPLDLNAVNRCLAAVVGEHDFSSFENSGSRDRTTHTGRGAVRTIFSARLFAPAKNQLIVEFIGDGFLKNMVRNLIGTALEVGRGKISPEEFSGILDACDRRSGGPTAPAHGLFLKEVLYRGDVCGQRLHDR